MNPEYLMLGCLRSGDLTTYAELLFRSKNEALGPLQTDLAQRLNPETVARLHHVCGAYQEDRALVALVLDKNKHKRALCAKLPLGWKVRYMLIG